MSINNSDINKHVEQGAPPLYVGRAPIHLAIMAGNIAMIDELIVNSANLSIQDYDGKTVLHYAAEYGDVEIMVKLLKALKETGDDVLKVKDNQGQTVLHYAVPYGSREIISVLIKMDATQINETDTNGSLPITLAYKNNKLDIFNELLNSGANISEELLAEISRRKDEKTLIKIVKKNKEILLNKSGKESIEVFKTVISFGNIPLIKQFLQAGWNVDLELNTNKETPLMVAISQGNIKLANYLLEKGANTKLTDKNGDSILIRTIYTNNIHKMKFIRLITDIDNSLLNTPNNNEEPPLYYAAMGHDLNLVKFMLDWGAKVNFKLEAENNLLHELMYDGGLSILEEIIKRDRNLLHEKNSQERNPFHQGLDSVDEYSKKEEMRFIELSEFLFKEKVDLNAKDTSNNTILDLALSKQFFKLSTKLIQKGALTNISLPSQFLERSVATEILESHTNFKKRLGKTLDKNPVIAMAQLNDLYLKIRDNLIKTPKGFTQELSCFSIFNKKTDERKGHDAILSILKEIYDDKLKQVPKFYQEEGNERYNEIQQDLELLIKSQEISMNYDWFYWENLAL